MQPDKTNLSANFGVRSDGKLDLSISAGKKNIFGWGEIAKISYAKTMDGGYGFDFAANKPFSNGSNLGFSYYHDEKGQRWQRTDVKTDAMGLEYNNYSGLLIGLLHNFRVNAACRQFIPSLEANTQVREFAGHSSKISLEHSMTIVDTRDKSLLPSRGFLLKMAEELTGPPGDTSFYKYQFDVQAAIPLFLGFIASGSFRTIGVDVSAGKRLHLLDRVYLGGPLNIRGFDHNSIGERVGKINLGGSAGFAYALHLYRPVFRNLFAHGFLTGGSVANVGSKERIKDMLSANRLSAGFGLVYNFNDVLRYELNYVVPLMQMTGDACASGIRFGAGVDFL